MYTNETYKVVANAQGFVELSVETDPPDSCLDRSSFLVTLPLSPVEDDVLDCTNCSVLVNLFDKITAAPVSAFVDLIFEDKANVASGLNTDNKGKASIPINKMGKYKASLVPGSGYNPADASGHVKNDSTVLNLTMYLEQPSCPNTTFTVNIKESIAGTSVADAQVSLILTNSLAGSSMLRQGPVHVSNQVGLVNLKPPINGEYRVVVEAEDFISQELQTSVTCDVGQCYNCNQDIQVSLEQEFCSGKELKIIVKDTTTNEALEGAEITWSIETFQNLVKLGTFSADSNGTSMLPISSNGKYSAAITKPGYLSATLFHQVSVSLDQCPHFAPSQLVPLSPSLEPGCVRLSLIWGKEPADLDLYSFKVNSADTDDRCLTYFCDGKDPCGCASFDVDNTRGGEEGAETITYCGCNESEDDFTHMVWVDDLSGKGTSLLSSEARILVTDAGGATQEVQLVPGEQEAARYWLAGCLTTNYSSFSFTPLNQLSSVQPSEGMPLQCYTTSQLESNKNTPSASLRVSVADTLGRPLPNASLILSYEGVERSEKVGLDGVTSIEGVKAGNYSLSVEHEGYVTEVVKGYLRPNESALQHISMMKIGEKGSVRIKLDWREKLIGRNLDLNLLKTEKEGTMESCLTYWHNMEGCKGVTLDQNIGKEEAEEEPSTQDTLYAKAETITVQDFPSMQDSVFLVYIEDNTASGPDLDAVTPHLTINEGGKSHSIIMPTVSDDSLPGVR